MKAPISARKSSDKQPTGSSSDQIARSSAAAPPSDPRLRAFCDALAEAVAERVLRDLPEGSLGRPAAKLRERKPRSKVSA